MYRFYFVLILLILLVLNADTRVGRQPDYLHCTDFTDFTSIDFTDFTSIECMPTLGGGGTLMGGTAARDLNL